MKTAHEWAVELIHHRIEYGSIVRDELPPEVFSMLRRAIFRAAKEVIAEALAERMRSEGQAR